MAKLTRSKAEPKRNYVDIAKEFAIIKIQKKSLEVREKALKSELEEYLKKQPVDAKKNAYLAFQDSEGKMSYLKYEARQSTSLDSDKAYEFFSANGLLEKVYKTVESSYFDEEEIAMLVSDGTISFEDLESITSKSLSYAMKVIKEKEEVAD